jgi:hypothetical protein
MKPGTPLWVAGACLMAIQFGGCCHDEHGLTLRLASCDSGITGMKRHDAPEGARGTWRDD